MGMNKKYKELFQNNNYRKSLAATVVNRFGDSVDAIASSWIVYELTGRASWSAIIFALNNIPGIVVTPLAGPWVESHNKKHIMVVTDIIRALCVGIMATGLMLSFLSAPIIAALTLIISTAEAFRIPAGNAAFPQIVPQDKYSEAMSLNQSATSVTQLAGSAAAALIIAAIGSAGAIYVDMASFLISAVLIMSMKLKEEKKEKCGAATPSSYFRELGEGFTYCRSKRILVVFSMVILFLNGILVPLNSLQSPMVKDIFHGSPALLSVMSVSITVTMLLGSVTYPAISAHVSGKKIVTWSALFFGVFYFGIVAASPLYNNKTAGIIILALLTGLVGFSVSLASMFLSVEMFNVIDKEYLARASGIGTAIGNGIIPVTAFVVSIAAEHFSVAGIFIASGVIAVVFFILLGLKFEEEKDTEVAIRNLPDRGIL